MRWTTAMLLTAMTGLVAACDTPQPVYLDEEERQYNEAIHNMWTGRQVDQAVLRQRTLYPYHFEAGSATLSSLGARDVATLARHYRDAGGELNVRQGDASEDLYRDRVKTVVDALAREGVYGSRVSISDGLPHGDGASSQWMLQIQGRAGGERIGEWGSDAQQ